MVTVGPDVYEASVSARASAIREIGRLRAIAARLVALAGAWTAVLVAGSVIGYLVVGPSGVGPSRPIDERIAGFFAAHGPLVPAGLSSLLPVIGLVVVVAIVVVLTIGDDARGRRVLPVVLGAIATAGLGAAVAAKVLKAMFTRPRPPRVVGSVGASGFSFPSSHTLVGWAILAACVVVLAKYAARASQRVAVPAIGVVAVTVPLSRLVLGVHWATDVIAGAALGAAWGTVAARLCLRPVPKEARRWSTRARVASGTTAVLIVIAIVPVSWSYVDALRYPGSADFATRTTDWLRNNGAGGVVDWVENARYARPSTGALSATQASHPFGDARSDLPTARRPRAVRVPVAVVGSVGTAIPEIAAAFDGRWVPVGDARFAHPAMYTATWRPEPNLPDVAVSSVWMDTTQLRPHVVAGTKEPGGAGWSWNARIPPAVHSRIVA
ncbi:MAG: phosphatase PAP2 family protein, partial [Actinobacteria bacterium]|nr:phosphatase PAP2 family protein [Actinomycetota bacterium]